MLTNSKYKILKGVINNLTSKIQGYPTVTILHEFTVKTLYKIDFKNKTLSPILKLSDQNVKILSEVFKWFDQELINRKIDHSEIQELEIEILISEARFLFFPYKRYAFNTVLVTYLGKYTKSNCVNGWL